MQHIMNDLEGMLMTHQGGSVTVYQKQCTFVTNQGYYFLHPDSYHLVLNLDLIMVDNYHGGRFVISILFIFNPILTALLNVATFLT